MNLFKKTLVVSIPLLSVIASTVAAEQFQKEDFEAVWSRGLNEFFDGFGREVHSKLTEAPIEKEKTAEIIKKIEPEVQQGKITNESLGENVVRNETERRVESMPYFPSKQQQKERQGVSQELDCKSEGGINLLSEFMSTMLEFNIKIMEDRGELEAPRSVIKKQFELYKQLTGISHPLEEETNKQRIEAKDVPQKVVDKEETIQKSPESDQTEVNNKIAILFYDSRINETIEQANFLKNRDFTHGELLKVLDELENYYKYKDSNSYVNTYKHMNINEYQLMLVRLSRSFLNCIFQIKPEIINIPCYKSRSMGFASIVTHVHFVVAMHLDQLLNKIKEDIVESMNTYKILKGTAHPRWDEFSRM